MRFEFGICILMTFFQVSGFEIVKLKKMGEIL